MSKGIVFKYEAKRLLRSKEYLLLLAVTLTYSISLLRGIVLYGVDYTAPFSGLTFSAYCSSLTPFLLVLILVLCARQFRTSERGAEAIISSTGTSFQIFRLIRCGAVACAFLIAALIPLAACFVFYGLVFDYTEFGPLLLTGILILIPQAVFLFGIAMLLGKRKSVGIYILLSAVIIISIFQIQIPGLTDIIESTPVRTFNGAEYNPALSTVDGQLTFFLLGTSLIIASLCQSEKRY